MQGTSSEGLAVVTQTFSRTMLSLGQLNAESHTVPTGILYLLSLACDRKSESQTFIDSLMWKYSPLASTHTSENPPVGRSQVGWYMSVTQCGAGAAGNRQILELENHLAQRFSTHGSRPLPLAPLICLSDILHVKHLHYDS